MDALFNQPGEELDVFLVSLRSMLVYLFSIVIVRVGKKRFFAKATAFDIVLGVMLGSVLSRGINGSAALWPSMAAGAAMVLIHWVFSYFAFHLPSLSHWVRGNANVILEDGKLDMRMMRAHHLTQEDLEAAMRKNGYCEDVTLLKKAVLEQNGEISVVA